MVGVRGRKAEPRAEAAAVAVSLKALCAGVMAFWAELVEAMAMEVEGSAFVVFKKVWRVRRWCGGGCRWFVYMFVSWYWLR